ncbi:MAG: hypothetical protein QG610_96 [Euryarchaeota archaeon]|nr:hypothetical protein [Euryarchaeota archaeon]
MYLKGLSVAEFYEKVFTGLDELGIVAGIKPVPYDIPEVTEPFVSDNQHASYDEEYVNRFWRILVQVDSIFKVFRGWFTGKGSPVHFFWHHTDLAFTLFSGMPAPVREGASPVEREASSHEIISFGFWAGDQNVREPAFYAYMHPQPDGLMFEPLSPKKAFWSPEAGEAFLMYEDVRNADSPEKAVLDFLESVYQAGAKRANWDTDAFRLSLSEKQFKKQAEKKQKEQPRILEKLERPDA